MVLSSVLPCTVGNVDVSGRGRREEGDGDGDVGMGRTRSRTRGQPLPEAAETRYGLGKVGLYVPTYYTYYVEVLTVHSRHFRLGLETRPHHVTDSDSDRDSDFGNIPNIPNARFTHPHMRGSTYDWARSPDSETHCSVNMASSSSSEVMSSFLPDGASIRASPNVSSHARVRDRLCNHLGIHTRAPNEVADNDCDPCRLMTRPTCFENFLHGRLTVCRAHVTGELERLSASS